MQFEYDPERLIDEVEKRPGIWDFDSVEYRTRSMRHELWVEVVKELSTGEGERHLNKSELRELEIGLQKKWKSIRDCYLKYLARPTKNKRPYIYHKKLQFLCKGRAPRAATQEDSSDSDTDKKRKRVKLKKKLSKLNSLSTDRTDDEDYEEVNDEDNDSFPATDYIEHDSPTPAKLPKVKNTSEFAFANVDTPSRVEENDPERLFLLSLLPYLKDIPQEVRLNVKMELMQVLQQASFTAARDHKFV